MNLMGLVLCALACWPFPLHAAEPVTLPDDNRLGTVHVAPAKGASQAFLFLISDRTGWNQHLDEAADELASAGFDVAGIDLPGWLLNLAGDPPGDNCHYLVGDLESASKDLQRRWNNPQYRHPVLLGLGSGATVAMAALGDAPAATLAGAVALDPAPVLRSERPFCLNDPGEVEGEPGGYAYRLSGTLPGWLVRGQWRAEEAKAPDRPDGAAAIDIRLPPASSLAAALVEALQAGMSSRSRPPEPAAALADLPLVAFPASGFSDSFAIVLSGDGGWRDLDASIAAVFVEDGLPTVGLDSLRYFWNRHEPGQVAADLDRIVRHFRELWAADHVLLVGYSFGADILPAVWPLLSDDTRHAVTQVSLLALGTQAAFEFHVGSWVGWDDPDARPIPPDLARMDRRRVQCFFGADESPEETGCRSPEAAGTERVERPGGHHFDGDYATIAQTILAGLERRSE
ncbi:virulence factor family protein [Geminicoccus roseus]|uniref:virulence factor family protein n=1 Tax=Geminicoccus roseus TaxID=404900 RepID=UPI00041764AA|nr:virulence factor family protein [Geminicoccus roseus]